ncbi:MAG: ABC transporter substrate-binding protein [Alphaproteobacteria bacterium]|nr:ABC transporter substrate-binding protein [Alphaproteobacteria bacterium]MBU1279977.1 ABC transporter substrate-binding protein [Alphaproteobacteria bacterium]MBU1573516.1 ABC transporter substrate-binding protein [Alphaproteobacteria bacterium]MBU1828698.1 ABC transporter substrate-binding protein [Alphaproteobacteria bacterium]MBU2079512.1 ABC transporter substrate-binding protein [Alphaproteobacteria bacterium]
MTLNIHPHSHLDRRSLLKGLGAVTAATIALPHAARAKGAKTIKIGVISPMTGPLSLFGDTDDYTVTKIMDLVKDGIEIGGETYNVEILLRDAQSNPNKAAELAGDLILNDEVHFMLPASATDINNPTADQCELYGVPCISSNSPWQAFVMPRGGAEQPFDWTYHFFWGLEDVLGTFTGMWKSIDTNGKVGMLFPRNADGETWGSDEYGLPPAVRAAGFDAFAPSMFEPRTNDFSAQIAEFKKNECEIVGGITYVADLKTFITQCNQQNYHPKVVTVAAALLFPSGIEAMGDLGVGMSSEVWWTPAFPYVSSLTGQTSRDIADAWEAETGNQWTQPLGYAHALWEVVLDTLKRSVDPLDRAANRDALKSTDLDTLVGTIRFGDGPHPNICKTPIFGGQWVKGETWPFDLKIVDSSLNPDVLQPEAAMLPLDWS